jgi:anti-anti-sigma factor
MDPQAGSLEVQRLGERTLVRFPGSRVSLGGAYSVALKDQLVRLPEEGAGCRMELDLSNVGFLFSDVMASLVALHKGLKARGGHLVLCNPVPAVYELFRITGLHRVFDVRREGEEPADKQ